MNKRTRLTISFIAAVFLLACASISNLPALGGQEAIPTANIPPTAEPIIPTATAEQQANILYKDDFSVASAELETYSDETGSVDTKDGVYVVSTTSDLWNWGSSASEFSDTAIEFDATLITGPINNNAGIGVICRLHTRDDNSIDGYLLGISGDGYYSIRSISSGTMSPLVDWTSSDTINQGNVSNTIRATCDGNTLILEVNGEILATADAVVEGPTSGRFAFAAVSFETDEPAAEVHFDNLVVTQP